MGLVGKSKEKGGLRRRRIIWEDNIKMDLEIEWGLGMDWSCTRYRKVAGRCEHGSERSS